MYISYIVLCDIHMMKLMYVYVQTLIMLLRLGMHTKDINKNKIKNKLNLIRIVNSTSSCMLPWQWLINDSVSMMTFRFHDDFPFPWWLSVSMMTLTLFVYSERDDTTDNMSDDDDDGGDAASEEGEISYHGNKINSLWLPWWRYYITLNKLAINDSQIV